MPRKVVGDEALDAFGGRVGPHTDVGPPVHAEDLGPGNGAKGPFGVLGPDVAVGAAVDEQGGRPDGAQGEVQVGEAVLVVLQAGAAAREGGTEAEDEAPRVLVGPDVLGQLPGLGTGQVPLLLDGRGDEGLRRVFGDGVQHEAAEPARHEAPLDAGHAGGERVRAAHGGAGDERTHPFGVRGGQLVGRRAAARPAHHPERLGPQCVHETPQQLGGALRAAVGLRQRCAPIARPRRGNDAEPGLDQEATHERPLVRAARRPVHEEDGTAVPLVDVAHGAGWGLEDGLCHPSS